MTQQQKAFILVETRVGKTRDVAKAIRGAKIPGVVVDVATVTGPYDIIVTVKQMGMGGGEDLVAFLHKISGIDRTVTCVSVLGEEK